MSCALRTLFGRSVKQTHQPSAQPNRVHVSQLDTFGLKVDTRTVGVLAGIHPSSTAVSSPSRELDQGPDNLFKVKIRPVPLVGQSVLTDTPAIPSNINKQVYRSLHERIKDAFLEEKFEEAKSLMSKYRIQLNHDDSSNPNYSIAWGILHHTILNGSKKLDESSWLHLLSALTDKCLSHKEYESILIQLIELQHPRWVINEFLNHQRLHLDHYVYANNKDSALIAAIKNNRWDIAFVLIDKLNTATLCINRKGYPPSNRYNGQTALEMLEERQSQYYYKEESKKQIEQIISAIKQKMGK